MMSEDFMKEWKRIDREYIDAALKDQKLKRRWDFLCKQRRIQVLMEEAGISLSNSQ